MKKFSMKFFALLIVLTLVLSFAVACGVKPDVEVTTKGNSFLTVDINPSFELVVGDDGLIESVRATNEEAAIVLADISLKGLTAEVAITNIVEISVELGYLNNSNTEVKINAIDENGNMNTVLQVDVKDAIDTLIADLGLEFTVDTVVESASVYTKAMMDAVAPYVASSVEMIKTAAENMTESKYRLIKSSMQANSSLTMDEALLMSVTDLTEIVNGAFADYAVITTEMAEDLYAEALVQKNIIVDEINKLLAQHATMIDQAKVIAINALVIAKDAIVDTIALIETTIDTIYASEVSEVIVDKFLNTQHLTAEEKAAFKAFMLNDDATPIYTVKSIQDGIFKFIDYNGIDISVGANAYLNWFDKTLVGADADASVEIDALANAIVTATNTTAKLLGITTNTSTGVEIKDLDSLLAYATASVDFMIVELSADVKVNITEESIKSLLDGKEQKLVEINIKVVADDSAEFDAYLAELKAKKQALKDKMAEKTV